MSVSTDSECPKAEFRQQRISTPDGSWHEAVVSGELQKLLVEVQLAAGFIQQHGLHAVCQNALRHAAEITKSVHDAGQQVMARSSHWDSSATTGKDSPS